MSAVEKYPWPWTMEEVGPAEFAIIDANGVQLFNISADQDYEEQENGGDIFSREFLGDERATPFLLQFERLLKGPK